MYLLQENPTPGGLSRSYCLEVFYKIGEQMSQVGEGDEI
jgi:hypothetical protein